ncbi:hypothetical protein PYCH_00370 [Pyrococcus yayanosii CH1]|uniref:Uncharacterized protein n=1 Tax=Pyrococcus yayanosii (strain CH1 / JCM 16557) TaxID=529709 RepID=F8AFE3_PYRYC|nr:hypothetical protein PYCH_00370 [Pyrococcus yayanosii CH1]
MVVSAYGKPSFQNSALVKLTIEVANLTPKDVSINFGGYTSGVLSFRKEGSIEVYAVEIFFPHSALSRF